QGERHRPDRGKASKTSNVLIVSPGTKHYELASCQVISMANSASWTQGGGQGALFPVSPVSPFLAEITGGSRRAEKRPLPVAATVRMQVMEDLGIHDVAGLVRYAIHVGLVAPDA